MAQQELTSIRIDKWLWAARFFKTRSLAQDAVDLGRVRIDGQKVKPAREVKPGDMLQIERGDDRYEVEVLGISSVRGSAPVAQQLYAETEASKEKREHAAEMRRLAYEPALTIEKGRPTKRDARKIRKVKTSW